jgi:hypothetical protein
MVKTRMKENVRLSIFDWMQSEYDNKHKDDLKEPLKKAINEANKAIRVKYPETDMEVLRKYKCTRLDKCLKFLEKETQRFFGIDFFHYHDNDAAKAAGLADLPNAGGCNSNEVFPVNAKSAEIMEKFIALKNAAHEKRKEKLQHYRSFLAACNTVDEFNDVVPLPDDLKQRYLSGGALIAINPDTISSIKNDFKA